MSCPHGFEQEASRPASDANDWCSDKTTISYTAVMGLRQDTHLEGQDYSNVAMMFVRRALLFKKPVVHKY